MAEKHYIVIEKEGEVVFREALFESGIFADIEFYKNLKLNINFSKKFLEKTEVDFKRLLLEWWYFLARAVDLNKEKSKFEQLFSLKRENLLLGSLYFEKYTPLGRYFFILNELQKFTSSVDYRRLEDGYKIYLQVL